jgi:hypothetical protein
MASGKWKVNKSVTQEELNKVVLELAKKCRPLPPTYRTWEEFEDRYKIEQEKMDRDEFREKWKDSFEPRD